MVLLINIIILLIAFRLLFEQKIIRRLMLKKWTNLITIQHIVFFVIYGSALFFSESYSSPMPYVLYRVVFTLVINLALYIMCYAYLVPAYYQTNKYPEYILYALILFIASSLTRILAEPIFANSATVVQDQVSFLISIYGSQSIVILVASFLGISKHKFMIENEYKDLEHEKNETDLNLMKSKINPHFLLNTLNNIYAGSYTNGNNPADSILHLSQLLQYVIYETDKKRILLSREFEIMDALAGLYQLKYNNQLSIDFVIEDDQLMDVVEIPPSIYLTLFENSLKHSSIGNDKDAFIKVLFRREGEQLVFQVQNSIPAIKVQENNYGYKGMGMPVLKKILDLEYLKKHELIEESVNKTYFSTLKIQI